MSTNPASLVAYHKMYGPETLSGNFVDFNMDDYIRSSLLGTKYLITGTGYHAPQKIYTSVGEAGADQSLRISMHFHLDICMIKNGIRKK